MKFVEVEINGKTYYEKIEEEAPVSENEEKAEEMVENKEKADDEPQKAEEEPKENALSRFCRDMLDGARELTDGAIKWTRRVADNVGDFFAKITAPKKSEKLIKMIPYMEEEDVHEIVVDLLRDEESLRDIDIEELLPVLKPNDCDSLFLVAIKVGNKKLVPENIAPYVSRECLSKVVDGYLSGEYADLDIDSLYPYLSSSDIKRVFYHVMSADKKEN